jgi:hypothetical protein
MPRDPFEGLDGLRREIDREHGLRQRPWLGVSCSSTVLASLFDTAGLAARVGSPKGIAQTET